MAERVWVRPRVEPERVGFAAARGRLRRGQRSTRATPVRVPLDHRRSALVARTSERGERALLDRGDHGRRRYGGCRFVADQRPRLSMLSSLTCARLTPPTAEQCCVRGSARSSPAARSSRSAPREVQAETLPRRPSDGVTAPKAFKKTLSWSPGTFQAVTHHGVADRWASRPRSSSASPSAPQPPDPRLPIPRPLRQRAIPSRERK